MKLGDQVAAATKAVGIEPCDACEKRRVWLNEFGDTLASLFKPAKMDEVDGPTCGCGKPSKHESGWCGACGGQHEVLVEE